MNCDKLQKQALIDYLRVCWKGFRDRMFTIFNRLCSVEKFILIPAIRIYS